MELKMLHNHLYIYNILNDKVLALLIPYSIYFEKMRYELCLFIRNMFDYISFDNKYNS